ncbi:hypothetical protein ACQP00_20375 [Dactylosporangium sp. CS-047395]|uniref:hypothetical protein n=1 Tax=Dactylosporangium sp. CS-047395 TaxID=3239936 RepID=UPI003D8CC5EB
MFPPGSAGLRQGEIYFLQATNTFDVTLGFYINENGLEGLTLPVSVCLYREKGLADRPAHAPIDTDEVWASAGFVEWRLSGCGARQPARTQTQDECMSLAPLKDQNIARFCIRPNPLREMPLAHEK